MNLSEKLQAVAENERKVYEAGKSVGYDDGYAKGYDKGSYDGNNEGYEVGYSEGYADSESKNVATINGLISRSLTNVVIPKGCSKIASYAFYYYNKVLKSVSVESTRLNGIYYCAFFHCDELEEFYIADKCNIRRFGGRAFDKCPNLKVIDLSGYSGADIPVLDSYDAFTSTHKDCVIIVPYHLYSQWKSATNWSAVADIIVSDLKRNAVMADSYYGYGVAGPTDNRLLQVVIRDSLVGNKSFNNNTTIRGLIVDYSGVCIGIQAFAGCTSLKSVVFNKLPQRLADEAFSGCTSCLTYDFSNCLTSAKTIPSIGTRVFSGINENANILVPAEIYDKWKSATNWAEYADYIVAV